MRKRYFTVAALFAGCVTLALGVFALLPPRPGVTQENFDRIEVGMSDEQVTALLGQRHGNMDFDGHLSCGLLRLEWVTDEGDRAEFVFEGFLGNARLTDKHWTRSKMTYFDRLSRRFGWK